MAFEKIIVLDDEMIIRKTLEEQLRKRRYAVASASNLAECEALLGKDKWDLVFADVRLPDGKGTELLDTFARNPDAPMVIMITGNGSVEDAVECMSRGAFSYLQKPFTQEQIAIQLKKAEEHSQIVKVNRYYSEEVAPGSEIIGESPAMERLKQMISRVAQTEATVLIQGENGTGKELVARELYAQSPLAGKPYIKVNCAAISETLMESEFFGHEKGAFTGATERREGRFELAHGGTILLDEISEIPLKLQAKLLRVLQEQEFERVGGNKTIRVNVRVLATTNRNLLSAVEKGEFREDLYYRLNVFPIAVPPLRERAEDVLLLAESFLTRASRKMGVKVPGFSKAAGKAIGLHTWPGNVRELQNTIDRAVILADPGKAIPPDLLVGMAGDLGPQEPAHARGETNAPFAVGGAAAPMPAKPAISNAEPFGGTLEELEKQHILATLEAQGGNKNATAKALGVSIRTLRNKLNAYEAE